MQFKTLQYTDVNEVVNCLVKSFAGYYVPMPSDVSFWEKRFYNARVDWALSWGAFVGDKLVGFVINAIDLENGVLTAYNTGTGVLPSFRGQRIVDKMYAFGMEDLIFNGVQRCSLEVIDQNNRAIGVYQRIGFSLGHKLFCFKGALEYSGEVEIKEISLGKKEADMVDHHYSWDNRSTTIRMSGDIYKMFEVQSIDNDSAVGYFIINPDNGYLAQVESSTNAWKLLFEGISQLTSDIKINNVSENRFELLKFLKEPRFENTINQYTMEMEI